VETSTRAGWTGAGMATGQAFYPRPPGSIPGRSIRLLPFAVFALAFAGLGAGGVSRSFLTTDSKVGRREPLSAGRCTAQLYQPPRPCAMTRKNDGRFMGKKHQGRVATAP
jgi:hypothetical protein